MTSRLLLPPKRAIISARPLQVDFRKGITEKLSLCKVFNTDPLTVNYSNVAEMGPFTLVGTAAIFTNSRGEGLRATDTNTSSGFKYTPSRFIPNASQGTCLVYCGIGFATGDGFAHRAVWLTDTPVTKEFTILRYSDSKWYIGWNSSPDARVIVSATGTYNVGDVTVVGVTWTTAGSIAYLKGAVLGTSGVTPAAFSPDTLCIGSGGLAGTTWISSSYVDSAIYWVAFWNRALSADEVIYITNNPMCLFASTPRQALAIVTAPSTIFRRSGSRIGTRTGTRQTWVS